MSTVRELFAPRFMKGARITEAEQEAMAAELGADSLFYLPLEAIARCIGLRREPALPRLPDRQVPDADGRKALSTLAAQPQRLRQRPHLRVGRRHAAYVTA